jgi:3-hydroxybutyryl-CoA dehydrogenase
MIEKFKNIVVIGAGTMGSGIAQTFAQYGYSVFLYDQNKKVLDKALSSITGSLDKQIESNIISEAQKNNALKNLVFSIALKDIPQKSDLVIEAIWENKEAKLLLFNELNNYFDKETIFASNTSSIPITELAASGRPDRFLGIHFMNPVPKMKLVEIIEGNLTDKDITGSIRSLITDIQKIPVTVSDYPGFVANRILIPMINEAIFVLYEGIASAEEIDKVMKFGMNHPMGPLQAMSVIKEDGSGQQARPEDKRRFFQIQYGLSDKRRMYFRRA